MQGFLYILKSDKNGRFYIGSSIDPQKRLDRKHNLGKVKATKNLIPWVLVFKQEYITIKEARKVEYKLKTFKSRTILEKIIKNQCCTIKIG